MIVPDAIQPYEGWKALHIDDNGSLLSPQQTFRWPAKQRAEALCMRAQDFRWELRRGKPPEERDPRQFIVQPGGVIITNQSVPLVSTSSFSFPVGISDVHNPEEPPKVQPPDGMHWSWEPYTHEPASNSDCSCGIYMVDTSEQCGGYLDAEAVLAEMYGWGNTIRGSRGARVQYGYPKSLIATEYLRERAEKAAELYGIPVEIVPDSESMPVQNPPDWQTILRMNQAVMNLTSSQKNAALQLQKAQAAYLSFQSQGVTFSSPPADREPPTPFVAAALVCLFATILSTINYFFWARHTIHGWALASILFCLFCTIMCLFIDYLIFRAEEKTKNA